MNGGKKDAGRRWRLLAASGCWVLIALANFGVSSAHRWYPDAVAVLATACAILTAVLAAWPAAVFAYRVGGTLAIGTLSLRCVSIIEGFELSKDQDTVWVALAAIGTTLLLAGTYRRWWLTDVKRWHEVHKISGR